MTSKLTLEQAIQHTDEKAATLSGPCAEQHKQLAEWLRELQERRKAAMDSEPVAWQIHTPETGVTYVETNSQSVENIRNGFGIKVEITPLYRHAQPAPGGEQLAIENFRTALEGIVHIRRTLEETFGGLHGTHVEPDVLMDCKTICDAIYAAYSGNSPVIPDGKSVTASSGIPVIPDGYVMVPKEPTAEMQSAGASAIRFDTTAVNKLWTGNTVFRAMLAAAPHDTPALNSVQSVVTVPGKWIPVSERMPDVGVKVLCFPVKDEPIHATFNGQLWLQDVSWSGSDDPIDNVIPVSVTHWMPLPAAPQEGSL